MQPKLDKTMGKMKQEIREGEAEKEKKKLGEEKKIILRLLKN